MRSFIYSSFFSLISLNGNYVGIYGMCIPVRRIYVICIHSRTINIILVSLCSCVCTRIPCQTVEYRRHTTTHILPVWREANANLIYIHLNGLVHSIAAHVFIYQCVSRCALSNTRVISSSSCALSASKYGSNLTTIITAGQEDDQMNTRRREKGKREREWEIGRKSQDQKKNTVYIFGQCSNRIYRNRRINNNKEIQHSEDFPLADVVGIVGQIRFEKAYPDVTWKLGRSLTFFFPNDFHMTHEKKKE